MLDISTQAVSSDLPRGFQHTTPPTAAPLVTGHGHDVGRLLRVHGDGVGELRLEVDVVQDPDQ